jgi:DNA-binding Lrp family transcriptional regulator
MNELSVLDCLILKGIAMGYRSPRKLSERINIDEGTIKDRIKILSREGYVCNLEKNILLFDKLISTLNREEDMGCGQLTDSGCNALDEESVDYVLGNIGRGKGPIKYIQNRPRSLISKFIDGAWYGIGFLIFVLIILVVVLIAAGLVLWVMFF